MFIKSNAIIILLPCHYRINDRLDCNALLLMQCYMEKEKLEICVDEAGRGPLLGRVYTAAVIWPQDLRSGLVCDSKLLKTREKLKRSYDFVVKNAVFYASDYATEQEIDKLNIRNATIASMHRAINKCHLAIDHILVDGCDFSICYHKEQSKYLDHSTVIKGDATYYGIAAASIIAKYERDEYIYALCNEYPDLNERYMISKNKGYGARVHMDGIEKYGISQFHRKSFRTCVDRELNICRDIYDIDFGSSCYSSSNDSD